MNCSRQILLVLVTTLVSYSVATGREIPGKTAINVLFIAVDDLRPELGCYGAAHVHSPNIDALAAGGMVFDRAYCQQAVCNPSRASIMTGLRPDTLQVWTLGVDFRTKMPNAVTIPHHFAKHGYRTVNIGKVFHNIFPDEVSWTDPVMYVDGFPFDPDAVYAGEQELAWLENRKAELIAAGKDKQRIDKFGQWYLKASATESADVPDNANYDGAQTDVAIEKLAELAADEKPFFFGIGYYRPHLPFNAPKKYWELYDRDAIPLATNPGLTKDAPLMAINTMRELRGGYYDFANSLRPDEGSLDEARQRLLKHGYLASVSYVDAQIGRLMKQLEDLGIADSTIVVLWSDHGWKLGEHNSWCKMTNYEIDARVPLIVRAPGMAKAGSRCNALVELVDVFPALCEMTNQPVPENLEGTSFAPLLADPDRDGKAAVFHQFLREGIWTAPNGIEYMGHAIRTDQHRYVRWVTWPEKKSAAEELYDLTEDPSEMINVASREENAALLAELRERLDRGYRSAFPNVDENQRESSNHE